MGSNEMENKTDLNKVLKTLGLEPFSVYAVRTRIKTLGFILGSYDAGWHPIKQFEAMVAADRGTGKTTKAVVETLMLLIEHPDINCVHVYSHKYPRAVEESIQMLKEYSQILFEAGLYHTDKLRVSRTPHSDVFLIKECLEQGINLDSMSIFSRQTYTLIV